MLDARTSDGEGLGDVSLSGLRNLGTYERLRVVLHDLGFHRNVAIVGRYSRPGTGCIVSRSLIYFALRHAIYQHPALSVMVAGKDTLTPYFVHIDKIDLHQVVTFEELPIRDQERATKLDEMLSKNNSVGFESAELPLWRVIVLGNSRGGHGAAVDIAFIWHHVIGDGKSGLAVLSTILQGINSAQLQHDQEQIFDPGTKNNRAASSGAEDNIVQTPMKAMLPALEEILTMPASPTTILKHKVDPWLQKEAPEGKWAGEAYSCKEPIVTKIRHISIPALSVKRLVDRCRKEQATMTPLLQAITGKVIIEAIEDAKLLRCTTAISLRRFFPARWQIDDNVMGLWVSVFHLDDIRAPPQCEKDETIFWDQVRKNAERIQEEIAKGDKDIEIGMLRYTDDFKSTLLAKMGKEREDSYGITNLGVFPTKTTTTDGISSSSPWVISNLLFSQSCHVNGSAIQFCIVSVEDGDMSIALSWQDGIVSEADVARVADQLRLHLIKLSGE